MQEKPNWNGNRLRSIRDVLGLAHVALLEAADRIDQKLCDVLRCNDDEDK